MVGNPTVNINVLKGKYENDDRTVIGEGAIIAAGALVLKGTQVGDGEMWGGVPAKFIKKVDPEQAKELNIGIAKHYIMYADWYKED